MLRITKAYIFLNVCILHPSDSTNVFVTEKVVKTVYNTSFGT